MTRRKVGGRGAGSGAWVEMDIGDRKRISVIVSAIKNKVKKRIFKNR